MNKIREIRDRLGEKVGGVYNLYCILGFSSILLSIALIYILVKPDPIITNQQSTQEQVATSQEESPQEDSSQEDSPVTLAADKVLQAITVDKMKTEEYSATNTETYINKPLKSEPQMNERERKTEAGLVDQEGTGKIYDSTLPTDPTRHPLYTPELDSEISIMNAIKADPEGIRLDDTIYFYIDKNKPQQALDRLVELAQLYTQDKCDYLNHTRFADGSFIASSRVRLLQPNEFPPGKRNSGKSLLLEITYDANARLDIH